MSITSTFAHCIAIFMFHSVGNMLALKIHAVTSTMSQVVPIQPAYVGGASI